MSIKDGAIISFVNREGRRDGIERNREGEIYVLKSDHKSSFT